MLLAAEDFPPAYEVHTVDSGAKTRKHRMMLQPNKPETNWTGVLRQMNTSSAVNPTRIATIVALVVGAPCLAVSAPETRWIFAVIVLLPLVTFLCQIIVFTLYDRDRLQNDRHVEQKMIIQNQITLKHPEGKGASHVQLSGALIENPRATESEI